jgi:site-specific DNA recombinase
MKAAIYTRVSTNLQEKDGTSLDSQEAACREYAEKEGHETKVFKEVGSGASIIDRRVLSDLRSECKRGAVSLVIVYAIDRLSRNLAHLSILLDEFERYGVAVHFVTEEFENTATGKFLMSARGFAAELEREKIRERCMRGRRTHAINGTSSFRRKLFGYYVTEQGRSVDPSQADYVRDIFARISDGESLRAIADSFNARGISTPNGSSIWWAHSVGSIAKNPAYCGRTTVFRTRHEITYRDGVRKNNGSAKQDVQNHIVLPDATPAIVTPEVFDAVQLKLVDNKKTKGRRPTVEALLRGRVRCGTCGRLFTPVLSKTYRGYVCTSRQNQAKNCHTKMFGAVKAEESIWQIAVDLIKHPEELKRYLITEPKNNDKELAAVNRSIAKQESEIERMVSRSAGVDDQTWAVFQKKIAGMRSEVDRLRESRTQLLRTPEPRNDFATLRRRAIKRLDVLEFSDKVELLKALNFSAVWDGETLKATFYAQQNCKSTSDGLYSFTVAGR